VAVLTGAGGTFCAGADLKDQYRRIRDAVEAIANETLTEPGRFPWLDGAALSAVVAGSCEHLHDEHEPALRAWLANRSS
jgi:enoyl-CoA hydratase/carnithine racemase